jgi:hypothetical protein
VIFCCPANSQLQIVHIFRCFSVDVYPKTRELESSELQALENYLTHLKRAEEVIIVAKLWWTVFICVTLDMAP